MNGNTRSRIQLYAALCDLKPTEPPQLVYHGYFNDPDEEILLEKNMNCLEAFLEDIRENGIKFALAVDPDGTVRDGNCRYWCAVKLGWKYVPVNAEFFFNAAKKKVKSDYYPKKEVITT